MIVAVLTVYNSPNYGSCWQACALCQQISKYNHHVVLYDTGARSTWKRITKPALLSFVKNILHGNIEKAKFQLLRLKSFKRILKAFPIIKKDVKKLNVCDVVVFGSDEIWNVKRNEMSQFPIFWGKGVSGPKKITYAVSVNDASEENLIEYGASEYLKKFDGLSVRDQWSMNQIQPLVSQTITKVLDPTLLQTPSDYEKYAGKALKPGYIALYFFSPKSDEISQIKNIAKLTGKRLVSIGSWLDWCDECVVCENPFTYYNDADLVITNTFHGTAFAINYSKQFISFSEGKTKILELLDEFDILDRIADGHTDKELVRILNNKINWAKIQEILDQKRIDSKKYISQAIGSD